MAGGANSCWFVTRGVSPWSFSRPVGEPLIRGVTTHFYDPKRIATWTNSRYNLLEVHIFPPTALVSTRDVSITVSTHSCCQQLPDSHLLSPSGSTPGSRNWHSGEGIAICFESEHRLLSFLLLHQPPYFLPHPHCTECSAGAAVVKWCPWEKYVAGWVAGVEKVSLLQNYNCITHVLV